MSPVPKFPLQHDLQLPSANSYPPTNPFAFPANVGPNAATQPWIPTHRFGPN